MSGFGSTHRLIHELIVRVKGSVNQSILLREIEVDRTSVELKLWGRLLQPLVLGSMGGLMLDTRHLIYDVTDILKFVGCRASSMERGTLLQTLY